VLSGDQPASGRLLTAGRRQVQNTGALAEIPNARAIAQSLRRSMAVRSSRSLEESPATAVVRQSVAAYTRIAALSSARGAVWQKSRDVSF
jgi:hypothetical protein